MISRPFIIIVALLFGGGIGAQDFEDLAGMWIWSVEGRTVSVIDLAEGPNGLTGTMQRPIVVLSSVAGAWAITDLELPVVTYALTDVGEGPDGRRLHYSTADSELSGEFMLRTAGDDRAILTMDANPAAPRLHLRRPRLETEVATDWEEGRTYVTDLPPESSNAEMANIYAADQADRQSGTDIDWSVVGQRDQARRERVREMLNLGLIRSGQDYLYAAFVYQHGSEPEDYLLAHALAMAAQAKGKPDAAWIAAATLDRFLREIDRAQIFGTQYSGADDEPLTQEPFDRELLTDALRTAIGVPTLEQQEAQRREMEAKRQVSRRN